MTQIFGDFIEDLPDSQEYLIIGFSPSAVPLQQRWRNNGLSADFLAEYLATFFRGSENDSLPESSNNSGSIIDKQIEIKSAVSFIANELIENAMKFNEQASQHPISVGLYLHSDRLVLLTTNSIHFQKAKQFQELIEELTSSDPADLYIRQLEEKTGDETCNDSQLGFLTMLNDYMTKIGWKFEALQHNREVIAVTTMVQLQI
ncbi:DUF6272 family protein [Lyngbya aestuarii]|uniref:DUF6272 family protein n=1 Tax=Lyngbya aestuarii TaxID=118322 RepID=UPI00403DA7F1